MEQRQGHGEAVCKVKCGGVASKRGTDIVAGADRHRNAVQYTSSMPAAKGKGQLPTECALTLAEWAGGRKATHSPRGDTWETGLCPQMGDTGHSGHVLRRKRSSEQKSLNKMAVWKLKAHKFWACCPVLSLRSEFYSKLKNQKGKFQRPGKSQGRVVRNREPTKLCFKLQAILKQRAHKTALQTTPGYPQTAQAWMWLCTPETKVLISLAMSGTQRGQL